MLLLLFAGLMLPAPLGAAEPEGSSLQSGTLETDIEPLAEAFGEDGAVQLATTVTNHGDEPKAIPLWKTPVGGVVDDIFDVTRNGEPIPYIGRLIKRSAEEPGEILKLRPGESKHDVIDLARSYEIVEPGRYVVRYRADLSDLPDELIEAARVVLGDLLGQTAVASFVVREKRELPPDVAPLSEPLPVSKSGRGKTSGASAATSNPGYRFCSQSQRKDLGKALSEARRIAGVARSAMSSLPEARRPGAERYRTWFGAYKRWRYKRVEGNVRKIDVALRTKPLRFNCGCRDDYYAYVYADRPYEIFLCRAFWNAAVAGTDSKSGTLIHEISHFSVVSRTADYAYGQSNAKQLARTKPNLAIANADSYEYFAENTPVLPMDTGVSTPLAAKSDGPFAAAVNAIPGKFGYAGGWREDKHPRLLADVNGDGRSDIIAFGSMRIEVALGRSGGGFQQPFTASSGSFVNGKGGWHEASTPRLLADVNGDRRSDIVAFGRNGVEVALGQASGRFGQPKSALAGHFGADAGNWRVERHLRLLGDVDGDRRADIVAFGERDVEVARGLKDGRFAEPVVAFKGRFTQSGGNWRIALHPRLLGDVNGDRRVDIVAFGSRHVEVALGARNGRFMKPVRALANRFGQNAGGWRTARHLRLLADVDGKHGADIVAFGNRHVEVALAQGDGRFTKPFQGLADRFGYNSGGWRIDKHPRVLADIDGDRREDIVAFGPKAVEIAKARPNGRFMAPLELGDATFTFSDGWRVGRHPRVLGDTGGDGAADIVGFGNKGVLTAQTDGASS